MFFDFAIMDICCIIFGSKCSPALAFTASYVKYQLNCSKFSKSMHYILHESEGNGMQFGKTVSYQQYNNAPLKVKYRAST